MRLSSLWSLIRDVVRVRKLRATLDRREAELSEERSAAGHLRCALQGELTNTKVATAVAGGHRRVCKRLEAAVTEVAIPALREREGESSDALATLEAALPEPIDEEEIRQRVMEADGWLLAVGSGSAPHIA